MTDSEFRELVRQTTAKWMGVSAMELIASKSRVCTPEPLKIGDSVRHKSGGPKMTIEGMRYEDAENTKPMTAICAWHEEGIGFMTREFPVSTLIEVD